MKDKRNCNMYPVYPTPTMPIINQPVPVPYQAPGMQYYSQTATNTYDIGNIENRLNNLENRVSKLEQSMNNNYSGSSNNYNNNQNYTDSNYYMV